MFCLNKLKLLECIKRFLPLRFLHFSILYIIVFIENIIRKCVCFEHINYKSNFIFYYNDDIPARMNFRMKFRSFSGHNEVLFTSFRRRFLFRLPDVSIIVVNKPCDRS